MSESSREVGREMPAQCGRCGGPMAADHYFVGADDVPECDRCVHPIWLSMRNARLRREAAHGPSDELVHEWSVDEILGPGVPVPMWLRPPADPRPAKKASKKAARRPRGSH